MHQELHDEEMRRRQEYDRDHGPPQRGVPGPRPFTDWLHAVQWPRNFKIHDLDTYNGKDNPEHWATLFEITIRAGGSNEDVMANYFPVVINSSTHLWLLGLQDDSIDSWAHLKAAFVNNYMATCR
jgi:hypothetical protein